MSLESFQKFLEWFLLKYCPHFETIDCVFNNEIEFIKKLETEIRTKAQIVEKTQKQNLEAKR